MICETIDQVPAMKLMIWCVLLFATVSAGFSAGKKAIEASKSKATSLVGNSAPEFALPDLKQQVWHLADGRGQLIVLAFWATWCPPCRAEMPMFTNLQKELSAEGVKVIPVAVDEPAKASKFLKQKNLEVWSLVDRSHNVAISYGASAIPKTFLIDRDGRVAKVFTAKCSEEELRSAIHALQQ
jgi:peroxiredoxin